MELFELTKAIFSSDYSKATRLDKRRNFFMIQRRFSIGYPMQANLLGKLRINQEAVVDFWHLFLRKHHSKPPFWIYQKGIRKVEMEKEVKEKISKESILGYSIAHGIDPKSIKEALKFWPERIKKEILEWEKGQRG